MDETLLIDLDDVDQNIQFENKENPRGSKSECCISEGSRKTLSVAKGESSKAGKSSMEDILRGNSGPIEEHNVRVKDNVSADAPNRQITPPTKSLPTNRITFPSMKQDMLLINLLESSDDSKFSSDNDSDDDSNSQEAHPQDRRS